MSRTRAVLLIVVPCSRCGLVWIPCLRCGLVWSSRSWRARGARWSENSDDEREAQHRWDENIQRNPCSSNQECDHDKSHDHGQRCPAQFFISSERGECQPQRSHHQSDFQCGTAPHVLTPLETEARERDGDGKQPQRDRTDQRTIHGHSLGVLRVHAANYGSSIRRGEARGDPHRSATAVTGSDLYRPCGVVRVVSVTTVTTWNRAAISTQSVQASSTVESMALGELRFTCLPIHTRDAPPRSLFHVVRF